MALTVTSDLLCFISDTLKMALIAILSYLYSCFTICSL